MPCKWVSILNNHTGTDWWTANRLKALLEGMTIDAILLGIAYSEECTHDPVPELIAA